MGSPDPSTPSVGHLGVSLTIRPDTPVRVISAGAGRVQVFVPLPGATYVAFSGDDADVERWLSEANVALSAHLLAKAEAETQRPVAVAS